MTEQEIATKEKQAVQGQEKTRAGRFFLPEVDIEELSDSLKLWADLPGVKQSDVEVTLRYQPRAERNGQREFSPGPARLAFLWSRSPAQSF